MRTILALAALASVACGQNPAAPSAKAPPIYDLDYAINVPDIAVAYLFQQQYPNGVRVPPIQAQLTWNYTAAYGGSPNVYYGPLGGDAAQYASASIIIAPVEVANEETFYASDWPVMAAGVPAGTRYQWVGRFVYTRYVP